MAQDQQPTAPAALRVLADGAAAVAHAPDLEAALTQLLDLAIAATGASRGAVLVQDPAQPELEVAAARGYDDTTLHGVVDAAGGEAAFTEAAARPAGTVDLPVGAAGALVTLLPLIVSTHGIDQIVGVLAVERDGGAENGTGAGNSALLYAIADLAAGAVDRAQLRSLVQERADWFERISSTDPLTGLANRIVLGRMLEHEVTRAGRQGTEISLVVIDMDGFRQLNESSGRDAGDRALQEVAVAIATTVRMVDTVGRLGGDEFAVIAPGSGGSVVARRLIAAIGALLLPRPVTVSIGVARYPAHGATAQELLDAAVQATREAQAGAGGRIVEASAAPSA